MNGDFTAVSGDATRPRIQAYRVEQISRRLNEADCPAIVLFDPVNIRYAFDRAGLVPAQQCQRQSLRLVEGQPIMERARAIRSRDESDALCNSLQIYAQSVAAVREHLHPRMRETDALALPVDGSILSNLTTFGAH